MDKGIFKCLEKNICPDDFNKLIPDLNQCIDNCSKDPYYNYKFNNSFYHRCPKEISYASTFKKNC